MACSEKKKRGLSRHLILLKQQLPPGKFCATISRSTQDIFLNITAKNFTLTEARKLPTPSGVSAAAYNSSEFFGRSQQLFFSNDASLAIDLFEGETAFKPVHWLIRP